MRDRDNEILPVSTPTSAAIPLKKSTTTSSAVSDHLRQLCLARGRYKFCALAVIILLAFWSMLTGAASLRLSAGNLDNLSIHDSIDFPLPEDLDALEMDERVKFVKRMWNLYISENKQIRLAKFWQQAFEAAYELLINDGVDDHEAVKAREEAFSEIAKMSVILRIPLDPRPPIDSMIIQR